MKIFSSNKVLVDTWQSDKTTISRKCVLGYQAQPDAYVIKYLVE